MNFQIPNFLPAVPEMFVLSMACLIMLVDLFVTPRGRIVTYLLAQLTLVGAALLTVALHSETAVLTFSGTFISDGMGDVLKIFIYLATLVVFIYSREYLVVRDIFKGEFFVLALFAVLGMMIMVSAHSMLTIYLGLELLSLSLYAMVAMHRDSAVCTEAAMKYFVLGALASGLLLYGMSMFYGATGTLDIGHMNSVIVHKITRQEAVLAFGVVFIIIGLAFKLGAVPFHMWIPDVYHGAPTPVTLFIGSAPKIAAFAMVMRLLVDGMGSLHDQWQIMLIILAVLSLGVGNIVAIAQSNIKRMLAYSTISHVGFIFLGILAGTKDGYSATMFYVLVYTLMSLAGFGMILLLSRAGFEADELKDFKGLNERSPWFAFMMLIVMFSMAGVPPFLGFYAKLSILQAIVSSGLVWLAALAVVFSIIGAFYYLRVVKLMYFDKPEVGEEHALNASTDMKVVMSLNSLAILGLGLFPSSLLALCIASIG